MSASSGPKTSFKDAIGVFGGRFDPPHRMHLAIARAALAQLGLAKIHWVVSGIAPHKPTIASPEDRLAMVQCVLAQENDSRMLVNDLEVKASREGRLSYTIDTLRALATTCPGRRLVLIIGSDQAHHFETWKDWQEILRLASLAVAGRPGSDASGLATKCRLLSTRLTTLDIAPDDISATAVRKEFETSRPSGVSVSDSVALYILDKGLYSSAKTNQR